MRNSRRKKREEKEKIRIQEMLREEKEERTGHTLYLTLGDLSELQEVGRIVRQREVMGGIEDEQEV